MTVIRSAIARTSLSLWVMKTIERPLSRSDRMTAIRSSISCGVSTAVGSSRISTCAWRRRALTISTRCCTPTGRFFTSSSGGATNPYRLDRVSHVPPGPAPVQQPDPRVRALDPERDVLRDGEDRDQHEMLVHHSDARGDRIGRPAEVDGLVVDEDGAVVRLKQPVQHVHQRALARAVLTEQRVDLAWLDSQVDVVVRDQIPETLGDAAQLELQWSSLAAPLLSRSG